jgi:hypothetical protein
MGPSHCGVCRGSGYATGQSSPFPCTGWRLDAYKLHYYRCQTLVPYHVGCEYCCSAQSSAKTVQSKQQCRLHRCFYCTVFVFNVHDNFDNLNSLLRIRIHVSWPPTATAVSILVLTEVNKSTINKSPVMECLAFQLQKHVVTHLRNISQTQSIH